MSLNFGGNPTKEMLPGFPNSYKNPFTMRLLNNKAYDQS